MSDNRGMPSLSADCSSCFGLCCVALPFAKSADFAFDKDAGTPCRHLAGDFRCGIHARLRDKGMSGCTVFDCFGAGQQVSQVTFGGRNSPQATVVFPVMRGLHELLWYLTEALALPAAAPLRGELQRVLPHATWTAAGIGRFQSVVMDWALARGADAVRTGLEDNIRISKDRLASGNAELAALAAEAVARHGRKVATPAEARALLGLKPVA